jgi:sugar O-acyltransferase (sialic acid O-acetyltransferase NeuD family)
VSRPLLILGTWTLAEEIADVAAEVPGFEVAGFVENMDRSRTEGTLAGRPVLWIDDAARFASTHQAVSGLATTRRSRFVEQMRELGFAFATLVHPTARVSSKSTLGEGTVISVAAVIAAHTRLGDHVFVNRGVLIGHHATIDDYVTIQPGANVAGAGHIGRATYIGMGAVVIDRIRVGSNAVVGAGAVVTRDVPDNVQVMGVPARVVKENIAGK